MCLLVPVPVPVHRVLILKLQISFAIPHPRLCFANVYVGVSKEWRDKEPGVYATRAAHMVRFMRVAFSVSCIFTDASIRKLNVRSTSSGVWISPLTSF